MKKTLLIISSIVLLIGGLGAFYFVYQENQQVVVTSSPSNTSSSSFPSNPSSSTTTALSLPSSPSSPSNPSSPSRPIEKYTGQSMSFLADPETLSKYSPEFVEKQQARLADIIKYIGENPENSSDYWIDLGLVKKTFDNFVGARDAWEYAKFINPQNAIVHYNLGNLYGIYLGNFKLADKNFNQAIQLNPYSDYNYLGLAEFYRDFYVEKSDQVDDVLLRGLENLPGDHNLILNLAFYYKKSGEKEKAIEYFEKFLQLPDLTGEQQRAIEAEIQALKN